MADNHRTRSVQESLAHMNAFEMKKTVASPSTPPRSGGTAASPSAIQRSGGTAASPSTQGREAAAPPRHSTPAAPPLIAFPFFSPAEFFILNPGIMNAFSVKFPKPIEYSPTAGQTSETRCLKTRLPIILNRSTMPHIGKMPIQNYP